MSYHILSIDAPECSVTTSKGQLIVLSDEEKKTIPLEDVASIIITSFRCNLSSTFLIEAAKHRIGLILCELYKPVALLLPINRGTDTTLLRNIVRLTPQLKRRLWKKTVDAKCWNQFSIAREWNPSHPLLEEMQRIATSQKETKEAETARLFWSIFSDTFTQGSFRRDRSADDFNSLFNYAYAILLSCVLRYLLAYGIDPTFGIFHVERAHATPLAYDLMEPFRVACDSSVTQWILEQRANGLPDSDINKVSKAYRQHISSFLLNSVEYQNCSCTFRQAIEAVIKTFRASVMSLQSGNYKPWTI